MFAKRHMFVVTFVFASLTAHAEYKLSLYYQGPPAVAREVERSFEAFRGDVVKVVPFTDETQAEMDAVSEKADIVWGGSAQLHDYLQSNDRILGYRSSELSSLGAQWRSRPADPISGFECLVIAYDPKRVAKDAVPERWSDLLDPRWKSRLAVLSPDAEGDSIEDAAAMVRALQWPYFESLAAQSPVLAADDEDALSRLASGQVLAAIVPYHAVLESTSDLSVVWPVDAGVTVQRPIAILSQKSRPAMLTGMAEQLVDYVLSVEGQIIGRRHGLYPTRVDVRPPAGAPASILAPAAAARATAASDAAGADAVEPPLADLRERLRVLFGVQ